MEHMRDALDNLPIGPDMVHAIWEMYAPDAAARTIQRYCEGTPLDAYIASPSTCQKVRRSGADTIQTSIAFASTTTS